MGTKRQMLDGEEPCFSKAYKHEPLFLLRATDANAPATVRVWAQMYYRTKVVPMLERELYTHEADELSRRIEKHSEALEQAQRMETYGNTYRELQPQVDAGTMTEEHRALLCSQAAGSSETAVEVPA